jgi:organic radical activating enzyme
MKIFRIKNRRDSLATNSSSTHSVIYKNKGQVFEDLGIFDNRYYDRHTETIAASREAKIRYIFANIFHWDELVELMSARYPEMKEYYPLVKDHFDIYNNKGKRDEILKNREGEEYWDLWEDLETYHFGEHCRGALYNSQELYLSFEFLCNIIDSPDIVIVGGSDEADFVYEQKEGCQEISHEYSYLKNITDKVKNGNYYVLYGNMFSKKEKLRLQVDSIPDMIPEYPELVDMKITNACEHNCPFCYMASTPNGKHADIKDVYHIVSNFEIKTEFALGGGNVLLHPHFKDIVKHIHNNNHIANITIRYDDTNTINDDKKLKNAIKKYVSGIGISVQKVKDVELAMNFINEMLDLGKHVSLHIIPEMIGMKKSVAILNMMKKLNVNRDKNCNDNCDWRTNHCKVLYLGLKQAGRGKSIEHKLLTANDLNTLRNSSQYMFNVDTAFINTYSEWFNDNYFDSRDLFLTRHEGEYSMFIDAVKCKAYTSSYKDDGAIDIYGNKDEYDYNPIRPINEIFGEIRRKNGFKVFERSTPYYLK